MIQYSISEIEKNMIRVDQILILGLKSGAKSQQLTVEIKTGKEGRVTKFSKIFKKSSPSLSDQSREERRRDQSPS